MQIANDAPTPKRTRAKASEETTSLPAASKKPRSRKSAKAIAPEETPVAVVAMQAAAEDVSGLIATTAYFIAEQRNFAAGHELEDWLEAERRVKAG